MTSVPPPPPPPTLGAPPLMMQPPPRPSPSLPPSNVVLLTAVPEFLHKTLGQWILPCGPARTILWYTTTSKESSSMALVTMMHGDGAWKLVNTVNQLQQKENNHEMKAYLVPASPDIPLPPINLEESVATKLLEDMTKSIADFKAGKVTIMATPKLPPLPPLPPASNNKDAGGGAEQEETDPLKTPAVLQAVRDFRKSLQKTSTAQQAKRVVIVKERLEKAKEMLRNSQVPAGGLPPTLPAGLPQPPPPPPQPSGLPPPPPPPIPTDETSTANDATSGKRPSDAAATTEPPSKKTKTEPADLRSFVAKKIEELMGEEELSLIDFVVSHVKEKKKPLSELADELQPVLEEDFPVFLNALEQFLKEHPL